MEKMPTNDEVRKKVQDTPLFKKLLADGKKIDQMFTSFKAEYWGLWHSHEPPIVVLRSHLLIEYFLDRYLAAAHPAIRAWDRAQLRFLQKLALADHPQTTMAMFLPALRCLNTLRNKVAHDLSVSLDDSAVRPIHDYVAMWKNAMQEPVPEGTALIEYFAELVCGSMQSTISMIEWHAGGHGLAGLLDWYADEDEEA